MRNKWMYAATVVLFSLFALWQCCQTAQAIPLFAQRYELQCGACHTVLPELNAFGQSFRAHGYRLPLPKHGTTGIAVRYQMEYEKDPAPGTNRFSPGGILLSNADVGALTAFVHYNLGAGGGPSALYLGFLATFNAHTQSLYRAGLFELPLAQSPGQRLDDLAPYGYYGTHVGLNDLALSSPRWGAQFERTVGATRLDLTVSTGEFKGSAYGGKPIATGETTWADAPETGLWIRTSPLTGIDFGGQAIVGVRHIVPTGRPSFDDAYRRYGLLAHGILRNKWDLQAEQWWGSDSNADGFGSLIGSSGGYVRLKYYPTLHSYLGVRYDAAANPFVQRDVVYYFAFHVTPQARLLFQQFQPIGGRGHFGAAFTIAAPWPRRL